MIAPRAGAGRTLPAVLLFLAGLVSGPARTSEALAAGAADSTPSASLTAQAPATPIVPKPSAEQQQRMPTPPAQPAVPKPPPDNSKDLPTRQVMPLLGSKARDLAGEDLGPVVDIVVDRSGRPRALVIDFVRPASPGDTLPNADQERSAWLAQLATTRRETDNGA